MSLTVLWPAPDDARAKVVHDDVGRTYRQFSEIIGPAEARAAMIAGHVRPERLIAVFQGDLYLGYLAIRFDGLGPFTLTPGDFSRRFGAASAAWRWTAWQLLRRREKPDEIFIDGFSVRPEARGLGAGAALLRKGEEIGRQAGKRVFRVRVRGDNPGAAGFYRKQGFEREGTSEISWLAKPFGHSSVDTFAKPL